ncbi:MAG: hypothetical protein AAF628_37260 [Planctomycetota bacterium]
MATHTDRRRPSAGFWLLVPVAAVVTWGVHEFAHFQAGRWLGYEMWVSMNQAGLVKGDYTSDGHRMLVAMAGPFVTYLQAAAALWWILVRRSYAAYPFLFLAFFTRAVAFAVGMAKPNDEARTSLDLGWPVWVLPSIAVGCLLVLTIIGSRTLRVGWRTNGLLYVAVSVIATAIVFGDPLVGRIAQG